LRVKNNHYKATKNLLFEDISYIKSLYNNNNAKVIMHNNQVIKIKNRQNHVLYQFHNVNVQEALILHVTKYLLILTICFSEYLFEDSRLTASM
jgi:hypothetical protein